MQLAPPPSVIVPVSEDAPPASGVRRKERVSPWAPTVKMPVPPPTPPAAAALLHLEHPAQVRRGASDAGEGAALINLGDHRSTRYCFVAPRSGRRL